MKTQRFQEMLMEYSSHSISELLSFKATCQLGLKVQPQCKRFYQNHLNVINHVLILKRK